MKPKLIFFCGCRPHPARSGLERRCLEMLAGYRDAGCEITLLSTFDPRYESGWDRSQTEALEDEYVKSVDVYSLGRLDNAISHNLSRYYRYTGQRPPLNSLIAVPPGLRRWVARHFRRLQPDVVVIVYAMWDGLLRGIPAGGTRRVMETIDLTTLNSQMWHAVEHQMPPWTPEITDAALQEDYYLRLGLEAENEEFRIYDRYDYTIAISEQEASIIAARAPRTKVLHIPVTMPVVHCKNTYDGAAVFPMGPNPFNWQGFYYFARQVLPRLKRTVTNFRLQVTGSSGRLAGPVPEEIALTGFVPDLTAVYRCAPFLVCPVYGGTGQLVKVVEGMAHGVPSIVLEAVRHRVPIRHGEDGLIAANAEEFAAHAATLWHDRELCRRLGGAARERVRREFNRERLVSALQPIVQN